MNPGRLIGWAGVEIKNQTAKMYGEVTEVFIAGKGFLEIKPVEGDAESVSIDLVARIFSVTKAQVRSTGAHPQNEIELVKRVVAEHYQITIEALESKERTERLAVPRMIAMMLVMERGFTTHETGTAFGGRDHGTVCHATKTIKARMESEKKLFQSVVVLRDQIEMVVQKRKPTPQRRAPLDVAGFEKIMGAVCSYFKVTAEMICGPCSSGRIVLPRSIAVHMALERGFTAKEIAPLLRRKPLAIRNALAKVNDWVSCKDKEVVAALAGIKATLEKEAAC